MKRVVLTAWLVLVGAVQADILWDQSAPGLNPPFCDQALPGYPACYAVGDVVTAPGCWHVTSVSTFFTHEYGNWAGVTQARLNVMPKTGPLPTDPPSGPIVAVTLTNLGNAWKVTASGLSIDLPGNSAYWFGLTPVAAFGTFGQELHLSAATDIGNSTAVYTNGGWTSLGYDGTLLIEGTVCGTIMIFITSSANPWGINSPDPFWACPPMGTTVTEFPPPFLQPQIIYPGLGQFGYVWLRFINVPDNCKVQGLQVGVDPNDKVADIAWYQPESGFEKRWDGAGTPPLCPQFKHNPQTLVAVGGYGIKNTATDTPWNLYKGGTSRTALLGAVAPKHYPGVPYVYNIFPVFGPLGGAYSCPAPEVVFVGATVSGRAPCPGDFNCDGFVNFADINPFVDVLAGGQCCDPTGANCDLNGDGVTDFNDINPFVGLLAQGGVVCP